MKKKLLLMMGFLLPLFAFSQRCDDVQYYIKGHFVQMIDSTGNGFYYKLENIESKGISFAPEKVKYGVKTNDGNQMFVFEEASTEHGNFDDLIFWRFDKVNCIWFQDSEVKKGEQKNRKDNYAVYMLLLDCSGSILENDFVKVKASARTFIAELAKANNKNVKLGIIGFNIMENMDKMVYEISELDTVKMFNFIDHLEKPSNTATALYAAIRKGSEMIDKYVSDKTKFSIPDNNTKVHISMFTFTDGYDNNSSDPKLGLSAEGEKDPYFQYIINNVKNKTILNTKLENYMVVVHGEEGGETKFHDLNMQLASDSYHFKYIKSFDGLNDVFEELANKSVSKWVNLQCYVPSSRTAVVRWTLGKSNAQLNKELCEKEKKPQPEKKGFQGFIGINVGGGYLYSKPFKTPLFSAGLDMAFRAGEKFRFGIFASYLSKKSASGGLLFVFNRPQKTSAFLLGAGVNYHFKRSLNDLKDDGVTFDRDLYSGADFVLRIGSKAKSGFYWFLNGGVGNLKGKDKVLYDSHEWKAIAPFATFHIGYVFGKNNHKNNNQ